VSRKPHRVRVRLAADVAATLRHCAQQAAHHERGGLLLGWWANGDIVVRRAVEVSDPTATSTTWTRHQHAAQQTLDQSRAEPGDPRIGYVGDWHTHPARIGISPTDEAALRRASRQYAEPTALIVALPDGNLDTRTALAGQLHPAHVTIDHIEDQPMTLPARAAALRGDDYQHIIGWYWACQALVDADIISVSVEDAAGGSFDDLIVLRRAARSSYEQIKSSNTDETIVDTVWLTTPVTATGKSPLQHFHATWAAHRHESPKPEFRFVTNRAFDPADPILKLRDKLTNTVVRLLNTKGPRSQAGKARRKWADHLGISEDELMDFLADLQLHHEGGEASWTRQVRDAMRAAGLRTDDDAIARGRDMVRDWVKTGAGPQTPDTIRRQVADATLLARHGTLVLAVHAIDRPAHNLQPSVIVDFVDLYEGDTDRERRQLRDPGDWQHGVMPRLADAVRTLEAFGVRRVHIIGAMRLPLWFATGVRLPDTRGWVVSLDQRNVEWRSDTPPANIEAPMLDRVPLGQGPDLAVAVGLTHNPTNDVAEYLRGAAVPVGELIVLGAPDGPGHHTVPDSAFAVGWAHAARASIRTAVGQATAPRLHLFLAAPAGAALMLGHHWNLMPPTTVYEHLGSGYAPTLTIT
jgi:hypothetical protein